ncbi:MAG: hypothetical protein AAGA92_06165 [Planctomycetota bacterium]
MSERSMDEFSDLTDESGGVPPRPRRQRRASQKMRVKGKSARRKRGGTRRETDHSHGGMHQRRNKRTSW